MQKTTAETMFAPPLHFLVAKSLLVINTINFNSTRKCNLHKIDSRLVTFALYY